MKKVCLTALVAGFAFAMCACDEGEFNDLSCDPATYQSECLNSISYMFCDPVGKRDENGVAIPGLMVRECVTGKMCMPYKAGLGVTDMCSNSTSSN